VRLECKHNGVCRTQCHTCHFFKCAIPIGSVICHNATKTDARASSGLMRIPDPLRSFGLLARSAVFSSLRACGSDDASLLAVASVDTEADVSAGSPSDASLPAASLSDTTDCRELGRTSCSGPKHNSCTDGKMTTCHKTFRTSVK